MAEAGSQVTLAKGFAGNGTSPEQGIKLAFPLVSKSISKEINYSSK